MVTSRKKSSSGFASSQEVKEEELPIVELEVSPEPTEPEEITPPADPEPPVAEVVPPVVPQEEPKIETPVKPFEPPRHNIRHPRNTPKFSRTV